MDHVSYQARVRQQREPRYGADVDASLLWEGVSQPVTIRNISVYGALIIGAWLPAVGQRVTLIAQGLEVCGPGLLEVPDRCGLLRSRAVDPLAIIAESGMVKDDRPTITLQRVGTDRYA